MTGAADNVVPLPTNLLEWRYAKVRKQLTESDEAQAQAQACASRGADLYLAACCECVELAHDGQTQQQIAQGIGRSQSMVAQMIAIGRDARIINAVNNSLPTDVLSLYLLTRVPDSDFQKCCPMTREQLEAHVASLPPSAPSEEPRGVGRPKGSKALSKPRGQYAILEGCGLIDAATGGQRRKRIQSQVAEVAGMPTLPARPSFDEGARIHVAASIVADQLGQRSADEIHAELREQVPESQRQRFDRLVQRAVAAHVADINRQIDDRVNAAVAERLPQEERARIDAAEEKAAEADRLRLVWYQRMQRSRAALLLVRDHWRALAALVHPDRAPPDRAEQFTRAMDALNRIKGSVDAIDLDRW